MKTLAIIAAALALSACTTAPTQHLHTAGEVVCDHRLELRAATALLEPRPAWADTLETSLDWLCTFMGWGE